jgi:3alpha(or 20beta)-hydroxysteroid dehydrogenase
VSTRSTGSARSARNGARRLDGKVAVVTGGARGQGEQEARLFVREGAKVVIVDVLDDAGEALANDLDGARYVHADVSREDDWGRIAEAAEAMGAWNVLVNNAAILRVNSIAATTLDEYLAVVSVNQVGTFLGMRTAIEPMIRAGGGSIVNISSIDGIGSKPGLVSYSSTKGAVRAMTKTAALELGRHGIRVNSVHPGGVYTPMAMSDSVPRNVIDGVHAHIPLRRAADPGEIATMVLFLASDEASYCTGGEFVVDGGWLAGDILPGMSGAD